MRRRRVVVKTQSIVLVVGTEQVSWTSPGLVQSFCRRSWALPTEAGEPGAQKMPRRRPKFQNRAAPKNRPGTAALGGEARYVETGGQGQCVTQAEPESRVTAERWTMDRRIEFHGCQRVEHGLPSLFVTRREGGTGDLATVPEYSPRRAGKSRTRPELIPLPLCSPILCHFASQDRNASPRKAGWAMKS